MTIRKAKETADTKVFGKNCKVLDNFKFFCIYKITRGHGKCRNIRKRSRIEIASENYSCQPRELIILHGLLLSWSPKDRSSVYGEGSSPVSEDSNVWFLGF